MQALDKQYSRTLLVLPSVVICDAFLLFSPAIKQASLGGCVRMIVTGAAPASPTVLGFLRAALGCQVGSRGSLELFAYCQLGNTLHLRKELG